MHRHTDDSADRLAVTKQRDRETALGKEKARADYLPAELVRRLLAGESAVRVWREHRRMTLRALAEAAGVQPSYLSEIETGKKPGSLDTMARIARALHVPLDDLAPQD